MTTETATQIQPWLHTFYPGWALIAWVLLSAVAGKKMRAMLGLVLPWAAAYSILSLPLGTTWEIECAGYLLTPFRLDALARIFVIIFAVVAGYANIYGWTQRSRTQMVCAQVYAASAIAAVLAGDLLSLLFCWELMAVASVVLIWGRNTEKAYAAGWRFILVHATSGALLFAGIFMQYSATGSWEFNHLGQDPGWWLILLSFCINAAVPPLHAWLPDAYPESTATGAIYLCSFTTKTAVYALVRGYAGTEWLAWLGVAAALYGVIYAILQNDIRRLLSYHLICQVGYMLVGIGIGTELAVNGSIAHAINNLLYKGLLFMAAGAILHTTGTCKLSELGGLARKLPWTFVFFLVGAFAIAGMPWLNGFVSKTMIFEEAAHTSSLMELLLIASASGTFLSIALKISYYAFFKPGKSPEVGPLPQSMLWGMAVAAFGCIAIGVYPDILYRYLPFHEHGHPYTASHILQTLQLLLWTAAGFYLIRVYLKPHAGGTYDTDWFYRHALVAPVRNVAQGLSKAWQTALELMQTAGRSLLRLPTLGWMERRTVSNTALWLIVFLIVAGYYLL